MVDVKGYSIADNAILPLTEGRVIIYMKYSKEYLEKLNLTMSLSYLMIVIKSLIFKQIT